MHTPAHVVVNLAILGRKHRVETIAPIVAGAILPDVPMFLFYLHARVWLGMDEAFIWTQAYHEPGWQIFFDLFNSLPLLALGFLMTRRFETPRLSAFFTSMILHSLGDLALHHSDAHRHLLPFLNWRFYSPISTGIPDTTATLLVLWRRLSLSLVALSWQEDSPRFAPADLLFSWLLGTQYTGDMP
jgi:hypothetical protein